MAGKGNNLNSTTTTFINAATTTNNNTNGNIINNNNADKAGGPGRSPPKAKPNPANARVGRTRGGGKARGRQQAPLKVLYQQPPPEPPGALFVRHVTIPNDSECFAGATLKKTW